MSRLEFIIDGKKLDVSESIEFTRVYRGEYSLDAKKNNYSYTVKFPFTYKNDLIFKRANALSYKSDFPYEENFIDVLNNGIKIINTAKLVLLSTTDSYECALTWEDADNVGAIINNTTKLGYLLSEFPLVQWNFDDSVTTWNYSEAKASTYGIVEYDSGGKNYYDETAPSGFNQGYTLPHPIVNYWYLLQEVFTALGITVNFSTEKQDFLTKLIIRPNKRINSYKNNIFTCCVYWSDVANTGLGIYTIPNFKNENYLGDDKDLGNNSFYFNVETTEIEGIDNKTVGAVLLIYDPVNDLDVFVAPRQTYRINCLYDCTVNIAITNCFTTTEFVKMYKFDYLLDDFVLIDQFNTDALFFDVELKQNDFLFFIYEFHDADMYFEVQITANVDESLKGVETKMTFPSLFHIPSCIGLTTGELIKEALDLTGSDLVYNPLTDEYSFDSKIKQNSNAFDLTKYVTSYKEVSYDKKYLYNTKIAQFNYFRYLSIFPINSDYSVAFPNENLQVSKVQVQSKFSTSEIQTTGDYTDKALINENDASNYLLNYISDNFYYNFFEEKPLHLLWNDTVNSRVVYLPAQLDWEFIVPQFWQEWFDDMETIILSGTIRIFKLNASISDFEFKPINSKGLIYLNNICKYYSIIDITKNNDNAEFLLLELY